MYRHLAKQLCLVCRNVILCTWQKLIQSRQCQITVSLWVGIHFTHLVGRKGNKSGVETREAGREGGKKKTKALVERWSGLVRRMSVAGGRTHTLLGHACWGAYPLSQTWWKTLHLSVPLHLKVATGGGRKGGRTGVRGEDKGRERRVSTCSSETETSALFSCGKGKYGATQENVR